MHPGAIFDNQERVRATLSIAFQGESKAAGCAKRVMVETSREDRENAKMREVVTRELEESAVVKRER
jgi:hypothetical protein